MERGELFDMVLGLLESFQSPVIKGFCIGNHGTRGQVLLWIGIWIKNRKRSLRIKKQFQSEKKEEVVPPKDPSGGQCLTAFLLFVDLLDYASTEK